MSKWNIPRAAQKIPLLKHCMSSDFFKKNQVHVAIGIYTKGNNGSWVR